MSDVMKLGDVFVISSGGTPNKKEVSFYENGTIPWVKTGDLKSKYISKDIDCITESGLKNSSAKLFPKNTVLLAMYGATIGDCSILPYEASTNQACAAFLPIDIVLPEYLFYFLSSKKNEFIKDGVGGAQPNISAGYLKKVEIRIISIEEQKRIVETLNRVDDLIIFCTKQVSKLDELVKSRFIEMFGDAENKIPISETCNVIGGYSFKSGDISNNGVVKILQIGNVYLDNVSWETTNYLPEGYDEKYSKFMLNEGDIVVALTRPIIQSLGNVKACIVNLCDLPCLLNQRVGRIVAKNENAVFLEFIYGCLMTNDFTNYVESCSIGCSQPNISTKDIENYLIPNATYKEQKDYVEFKKQTDKLKLEVKQSLEKLETLKKSLMQKYFG